ncbi:glyoxalase/bleomycin resistance/dioxygenase family protein [Vibrio fluvialis]|nr:glyoxalase/bleomycin resistance/dioxygenase family protein [Vibrio fluvialis]MBY7872738.1 glyoxalase/bleomycin resistance/dioxygenase family protein [Vibrio fluvialis]
MPPSAVLIHVPDVQAGLAWYQKAFPQAMPVFLHEFDFTILDMQGFSIEIVQADEKVSTGKSGSVLYWRGSDFEETLAHFLSLGAKLYRGPLNIESGMVMCQVEDPFGNLIGLRGMS